MTHDDFKAAQSALGLTNSQMADALGMSIYSVREMRLGRRPVTDRTAATLGLLQTLRLAEGVENLRRRPAHATPRPRPRP
jgi:hypothetical protein